MSGVDKLSKVTGHQSGDRLAPVLAFARSVDFEEVHALQVAVLAQQLFGYLPPAKKNKAWEPEWLEYAAVLHDIGYINGVRKHHRIAEEMIRKADLKGFRQIEQRVIAAVARAHRKRYPAESDPVFAGLENAERESVMRLAAVLRVADGLDRTHRALVRSVSMRIWNAEARISCLAGGGVDEELRSAKKKSDLLSSYLGVPVEFDVVSSGAFSEREGENGTIA